jgi:hypothetical protein
VGGVGGGIDPGNVEFRESVHVAEDGFELRLKFCDLSIGEFEAGEIGDVADIDRTVRHGHERLEKPKIFQVPSASNGKRGRWAAVRAGRRPATVVLKSSLVRQGHWHHETFRLSELLLISIESEESCDFQMEGSGNVK